MSLPDATLLGMCLYFSDDPEPLHTLTERMKALCALSETCREVRAMVRDLAFPALSRRFGCDVGAVHTIPTVSSLVHRTDGELARLEDALCTAPSRAGLGAHAQHRRRPARVDALLRLAASEGALWRMVPLKRELRRRRECVLGTRDAIIAYRLRAEDLAGKFPPYSREDLATIALARHGSELAMRARDAAIRASSKKRVDTRNARDDRRDEIDVALISIAEIGPYSSQVATDDYRHVTRWHEGMRAAVERYVLKGTRELRDAALAMFRNGLDSLRTRRAEVGSLPWPPTTGHAGGLLAPSSVASARRDYVDLGDPDDLEDATAFSTRWTNALHVLRGVGGHVPAETLVETSLSVFVEVKRYLHAKRSDEDERESERALSAMAAMYTSLAEAATALLVNHPRSRLIARHFPTTISPELGGRTDYFKDHDQIRCAAERIARNSTERAVILFCDSQWSRVAQRMPSRILTLYLPALLPERPMSTSARQLADPFLRRLFASSAASTDWDQIATFVLNAWNEIAGDEYRVEAGSAA